MAADSDARFAVISSDPRFKPIPKQERKVKIDRRFEAMFKDKKFKLKYSIDKRGRPLQQTTDESLRKFYEISESDSSDDESAEGKVDRSSLGNESIGNSADKLDQNESEESRKNNGSGHTDSRKKKRRSGRDELNLYLQKRREHLSGGNEMFTKTKQDSKSGGTVQADQRSPLHKKKGSDGRLDKQSFPESSASVKGGHSNDPIASSDEAITDDDSSGDSSDDSGPHRNDRIDYSRGGAFMDSSSSSDESDSDTGELENVDIEHGWGEMDNDATRAEDTSSRLALCNMDWDRISAQDILVILSSFKPSSGVIKSVKIYISDLGLERMKDEDIHGPKELVEKDDKFEKLNGFTERKYFREKLRKYQFQRLRYYYAVVECDSVQTATNIYDQCDNYEFESSAVKLDLRFIPDDMTFDREPREVAVADSLDLDLYKPSEFVNSALQQSKVDLTWDEDNPERIKTTKASFTKEELETTDLKAYLASSSGEEDSNKDDSASEDEDGLTEKERLEKYRSLVKDLDKEEEDGDAGMEITWEPALKETTEELVSQKIEQDESAKDDKTPWQQYLGRRKEKKKEKKEQNKTKEEDTNGEDAFSDDELPASVDIDDPFFSRDEEKGSKKNKSKKKRKKDGKEGSGDEGPEELQKKAELELLMMDEDDNKQHFNLKDIIERENPKKRKKRKKQKTDDPKTKDDTFEVDVKDSRFDAIYSSHHFAIDPSDPQFKKTKAMDAIMGEKQTRRAKGDRKVTKSNLVENLGSSVDTGPSGDTGSASGPVMKDTAGDVSALIKSIKRNTGSLKSNKEKGLSR